MAPPRKEVPPAAPVPKTVADLPDTLVARFTADEQRLLDAWLGARCKWGLMLALSIDECKTVIDVLTTLSEFGFALRNGRRA